MQLSPFPQPSPPIKKVVVIYVTVDTGEVGLGGGSLSQTQWQVIVPANVTQLDMAYAIRVLCCFV